MRVLRAPPHGYDVTETDQGHAPYQGGKERLLALTLIEPSLPSQACTEHSTPWVRRSRDQGHAPHQRCGGPHADRRPSSHSSRRGKVSHAEYTPSNEAGRVHTGRAQAPSCREATFKRGLTNGFHTGRALSLSSQVCVNPLPHWWESVPESNQPQGFTLHAF